MQRIDADGSYRAEWAGFEVRLQLRGGLCHVEVWRMSDDVIVATMPDLPRRSVEDAIRWVARWIEKRGASVMIDGRVRDLGDFLVFQAT